MPSPIALSVLRNRAAVAEELRRLLPKMEGFRTANTIPFGLSAIDRYLPQGGLACGALHEVVPDAGATPAAFGFIVALLARLPRTHPLLLAIPAYGLRDYGRPHGRGLNALGFDSSRLILVETAHRKDTLWAMEEALRSRAPAAVAGVIDKLDLKTSQRLQLAATDAGLPLFLLRPAEILESSAAATRWRVGAVPAARDRFGLITRARWQLTLERCRNGRAGEWMVEYDHVAHRFSLAAALADSALPRGADEKTFRQAC
jgi:protein ImuA